MRALSSLPSLWPVAALAIATVSLVHCAPQEQDIPLNNGGFGDVRDVSSSGNGGASGGTSSSGGASSGDNGTSGGTSGDNGGLGPSSDNPEVTGGTSGSAYTQEELGQDTSDPPVGMGTDFDPGDGNSGYYAELNDDPNASYMVGEDGKPNGGGKLFPLMPQCPLIELGKFKNDSVVQKGGKRTAVYSAPMSPRYQNLSPRLGVTIANSFWKSFLNPLRGHAPVPLGFVQPPSFPFVGDLWPRTYPYESCERCVFISTPDPNKVFMAVGGLLFVSPVPSPTSGKIFGRIDLAVFLEHRRENQNAPFKPVWDGACVRLRHAKLISLTAGPTVDQPE